MKQSPTQLYLELVKRRVASLRLLAKELRECWPSFTGMDLDATRGHISYQQGLCSEIRCLDGELTFLRRHIAQLAGVDPDKLSPEEFAKLFDAASALQFRQASDELAGVANGLRRLNRVYAGMIRRSRRSINVLINVMASYVGAYGPSSSWNTYLFRPNLEM